MPYEFVDDKGKTRSYRTDFQTTEMRNGERHYTSVTSCGQRDCGDFDCAVEANRRGYGGCFFLRGGLFMVGGILIFLYSLLTFTAGGYQFQGAIYGVILGLLLMAFWTNRVRNYRREYAELMEIKNTGHLSVNNPSTRSRLFKAVALLLVIWFIFGFYTEVSYDRLQHKYEVDQANRYHGTAFGVIDRMAYNPPVKPTEIWYPGKGIMHSLLKGAGIIERKLDYSYY